jgi:hypothetical protein
MVSVAWEMHDRWCELQYPHNRCRRTNPCKENHGWYVHDCVFLQSNGCSNNPFASLRLHRWLNIMLIILSSLSYGERMFHRSMKDGQLHASEWLLILSNRQVRVLYTFGMDRIGKSLLIRSNRLSRYHQVTEAFKEASDGSMVSVLEMLTSFHNIVITNANDTFFHK